MIAHLMVVQVAIRPPVMRVRAQILQQLVAHAASEAPRVPAHVHRAHASPNDRPAASSTNKPAPLRSLHPRVRQCLLHLLRLWLMPPLRLGRSRGVAWKRNLWNRWRRVVRAPDVDRRYAAVIVIVPEGYPRETRRPRRARPRDVDDRPVKVVLVAIPLRTGRERDLRDARRALR